MDETLISIPGADIHVYKEECKRISTCRLCPDPILKGTERVVIARQMGTPLDLSHRSPIRKGKVSRFLFFFHPRCIADCFASEEPAAHCYDCKTPINTIPFHYTPIRWGHAPLCSPCALSSRWRYCSRCTCYYIRSQASALMVEDFPSSIFICDACQRESGEPTQKSVRLERRLQ